MKPRPFSFLGSLLVAMLIVTAGGLIVLTVAHLIHPPMPPAPIKLAQPTALPRADLACAHFTAIGQSYKCRAA